MNMKHKNNYMIKKFTAIILTLVIIVSGLDFANFTKEVSADTDIITLYFIDNTAEKWIKNDDAVIQLVDNTNGHNYYDMVMIDDITWSVSVPKSVYNVTFNRFDKNKTTQWNSWSAAGRDLNNVFYADGLEYGHWEFIENYEENYFHAGDIIYLDLTDFTSWENSDALMYVNFSNASKENNDGKDINIGIADSFLYSPVLTDYVEDNHIYAYIVSKSDEGKSVLRFWRGNNTSLWNSSVTLDYSQYKRGYNCINVNGWNSSGYLSKKDYEVNIKADKDNDDVPDYLEAIFGLDKYSSDTDGDGLSDYDEINIYFTAPLTADTDGDKLDDGDEIVLGFDPNLTDTNGNSIIDSEEYIEQTVNNDRFDSELYIDNVATPTDFTVSAKGNVNSNIWISEYNGHLKGEERSYVGKPVEISGSDFDNGNICFKLDSSYDVKNYKIGEETTNGLIICYNDGKDTLPLETLYNSDTKTLKADIKGKGIYFVLDVISWIDTIGIEYEIYDEEASETNNEQPIAKSKQNVQQNSENSIANVEIKGQTDIVFIVDTTDSMASYINNVKNNITDFVNDIEAAGITPYFALVDYKDITNDGQYSTNVKKNTDNSNWFKNPDDFKKEISKLGVSGGGDAPETVIDALEMARQLDLRKSSQKFFIVVTDAGYKTDNNYGIKSMSEMINYLKNDNINVSVVSALNNKTIYKDLYENTGGVFANVSGNFKEELLSIADIIKKETNNGYWVALNGLIPQLVKLNEKPVVNGTCDTDGDSLLDWNELNDLKETKSLDITPYLNKLGFDLKIIDKSIPVYDYISNPVKVDSDDDGLLDGKAIYSDLGEIIAPVDYQPLEKNGTKEIWESHIDNKNSNINVITNENTIPDNYCNNDDFVAGIIDSIPDYAQYILNETEKKLANQLVKILLMIREPANENDESLRKAALVIKKKCEGSTTIGAYILNFIYDDDYMAYHSQPDTWQRAFGYNDFYDDVFRIGSYMDYGKLLANCNGEEYALWLWKGDYWNLHTGSEIGLYVYDGQYSGTDHYNVVDFEVPMKLYLYNRYSENNIENVFSWEPKIPQWWITGFNPNFKNPNPDKMVTIGRIDLSYHKELYSAFSKSKNYVNLKSTNLLFDDLNNYIWIIWE